MIRRPIPKSRSIFLGLISVCALLVLYTWLSHRQHVKNPKDTTIPSWGQMLDGVKSVTEMNSRSKSRWLVDDAKESGYRLAIGLIVGGLGGLVLGMAMGCLSWIEAILHPPLSLLAKIPPTAALAVFFVIVGTGTSMYISMIAFGILPTLAITVYLAVKEFPDELQYKAYTLGASHLEVVFNTILPCVLPKLIDALRLAIGPAMVFLIAAEMVVGDVGFGYRIRLQMKLLNMNVVYPYLAMLAMFGYSLDYLLRTLRAKLSPWYVAQHS
jgi:NitT/TauT family transport system permease protein